MLLETIPGLRFRSRLKHQDRTASRNYFRNLVDAHATGTLSTSAIRDVLGSEGYSAQYEHSLRVIPLQQLSEIDWTTPLGRGENGAVYAATWDRPASVLVTSTSSGPVPVVLKEVISRKGQNHAITKKLMKEVRVVIPGLGFRLYLVARFVLYKPYGLICLLRDLLWHNGGR